MSETSSGLYDVSSRVTAVSNAPRFERRRFQAPLILCFQHGLDQRGADPFRVLLSEPRVEPAHRLPNSDGVVPRGAV